MKNDRYRHSEHSISSLAIGLRKEILREIQESMNVKEALKGDVDSIMAVADAAVKALKNGGKVILFGNGGSAADAQHFAGELIGKFKRIRDPISALALTTDTSVITAVSNDMSFGDVFSRQIRALASNKDMVIGISTSGNSENVIRGVTEAKRIGCMTVALTGRSGGKLTSIVDRIIKVPSDNTQRIQEAHTLIGHIICGLIESEMSAK